MGKLNVVTIVGTRPEIIRLSECIKKFDLYFNHSFVHTGQNWDHTLNQIFFDEFGLREPDYYLNVVGYNLGETMGNIIAKSFEILSQIKPDALVILGDTNSALSAISAKRLKIPIFHMEAGNRCFDQNVPEEINRKIIDHISDVNLAYTEHARRYLISEGFRKEHIFVTGSPMVEILNKNESAIENSQVLDSLNLEKNKYILVSAHREENINIERNFYSLMNALNDVAEQFQMPIIFSTHPRTWKTIEEKEFKFHQLISKMTPFGFHDYNKLQKCAFCVLSDSGTISEESAILDFPAVSIRTSTERPEVLDKGTIILGGISTENIIQSIVLCREMELNQEKTLISSDYLDDNVSVKVVKIIQSFVSIINRVVWMKEQ